MLIGFPLDFWSQPNLEKVIGSFVKLMVREDHNHLVRVLVKAKVVDLKDVPWFILLTEADDFEGESWTAQCEILQTHMLGAAPPT